MRYAIASVILGAGLLVHAQFQRTLPQPKAIQACQNTYTEMADLMEKTMPFVDQAANITTVNLVRQLRNIQLKLDPGPLQYDTYLEQCRPPQLSTLQKHIDELKPLLAKAPVAAVQPAAGPRPEPAPGAVPSPTASHDSALTPDTRPAARARVVSAPVGAEIDIDGTLHGNTPSLIKLSPGSHTLKLSKQGYKEWQRTISIEPGDLKSFSADLEKVQ